MMETINSILAVIYCIIGGGFVVFWVINRMLKMAKLYKAFAEFCFYYKEFREWKKSTHPTLSNCCSAPITEPDICSECKEHCEGE